MKYFTLLMVQGTKLMLLNFNQAIVNLESQTAHEWSEKQWKYVTLKCVQTLCFTLMMHKCSAKGFILSKNKNNLGLLCSAFNEHWRPTPPWL